MSFKRLATGKEGIAAPIKAFSDSHFYYPGFGTTSLSPLLYLLRVGGGGGGPPKIGALSVQESLSMRPVPVQLARSHFQSQRPPQPSFSNWTWWVIRGRLARMLSI